MGFKNWETPPDFFRELNEEFHFTVDAAASDSNHLLPVYWTEETDGLAQDWSGHRVFCNPPYDSSLYWWVFKAAQRRAEVAVLLLPPSVDTRWFHEFIWGWTEVRFLRGRLKFWLDGRPGPAPRAGNMLAIFRKGGDV